jgi:maleylpyruvate isomerase
VGETPSDRPLDEDPDRATGLCRDAHHRLLRRLDGITDDTVVRPSRLPGWTVGHVVTHLARNADAHARRVAGALRGEDVPKYDRGATQRADEIEAGADRPPSVLLDDLTRSVTRLDAVLAEARAADWPYGYFLGGDYGVAACPAHRLREVEVHHVDLGLGYTPDDWPAEYVAWDLTVLLRTVPERLPSVADRRALVAWLAGRRDDPPPVTLAPW